MNTLFAVSYCAVLLCESDIRYRIPFAFLLFISNKFIKQKRIQPDLRQRFAATIIKTICDTLPLWLIRTLFYLSGVFEQIMNGLFMGEKRRQWCSPVKGNGWKGYFIGENAKKEEIGQNADLVIIYSHGGGFTIGGALVSLVVFVDWIKTWKGSHGAKTHIVSLEYGLAPKHPFPAARDSLLACYDTLVNEKGISPSKIAFAGDSAGGNSSITAALELLLNPSKYSVPPPSCLLLISPLVSVNTNLLPSCPLISPLFERRLEGLPRTWVCVGDYDVLQSDITSFVEKARSQHVQIDFVVEESNMHNYAITYPLSRNHGAQKAAKHMSRFLFGDSPIKKAIK
ncbi:8561_t:CDS:2 [Diversispora eburnea]|uniref:8561_t:CDS:1 n=1 Tax=Diversispora eburnea TaxID=1213867 RepID=A0A9N8VEX8_9GLOM|nr:8561_t:CDS:2 [Diversispora eburnea]